MDTPQGWRCIIGRGSVLAVALALALVLLLAASSMGAKQYEVSGYDVEMTVTSDGSYLITERITYHFLEGSFSTAYREVPGKGFTGLRFISLSGVDVPILSQSYTDGRRLNVEWSYPETDDTATFELVYEAQGALRSVDGHNVIDWNAVGSGWDVDIRDVTVSIQLPEAVTQTTVHPAEDVTVQRDSRIELYRAHIPRRTHYQVRVEFPEIIPMPEIPTPPYGRWVVIGLAVGLLLLVLEVWRRQPERVEPLGGGHRWERLDYVERAYLYRGMYEGPRLGVNATIFSLGERNKLHLIVRPKRSGLVRDEVEVEVLDETELSPTEQTIALALKKNRTLAKLAADAAVIRRVSAQAKERLIGLGLISTDRLALQSRIYRSALVPMLLSVASFVYGGVVASAPTVGLGIVLVLMGIGRLIAGAAIPVLSPEGLYAKEQIEQAVDETLQLVEASMERDPREGYERLIEHLPLLVLHPKFNRTKLQSIKKQLQKVDVAPAVAWIVGHGNDPTSPLNALTPIDTVNLVFVALMVTSANTGAPGFSGGGAGGAGGGGGGAG